MNSQTAVERALRMISPAPSDAAKVAWRTALNTLIEPARMEMVDQLLASGDREWRELLRKEWPVIASGANGRASLTALVNDAEPLLLKYFNTAEIYIANVQRKVTLVPDESAVTLERPAGFPFGTLIGTDLLVYNGGAPFQGNVTIRGPYMPTLANFKSQLDEKYALVLYSLATQKTPSKMRTEAQELKTVAAEGK